jgi:starch phosphorylase
VSPSRRIPTPTPGRLDVPGITEAIANRMMYSVAKDEYTATDFDFQQGLAFAVRDRLMERWFRTQDAYYRADAKRVYYLSLEFLTGRALLNNILNLGATGAYREAVERLGWDLEDLGEREWDAGLGNGGLGRLAACFLDSAASVGIPFYGYGIRYEYGIFRQHIQDGFQMEAPDNWLRYGNPWEVPRPDALFPVSFYGRVQHTRDLSGHLRVEWVDAQTVWAMAYDTPIAGYRNGTVNTLRLWSAKSSRDFDLSQFNAGEYVRAVEDKTQTENISKVLYPRDDQYAGKELRLKQQHFFVSATLQDILRRFRKRGDMPWDRLPDKVAAQLNDTHPVLAVPELMRVLVDQHQVEWDRAWDITQRVFAYTNHTVLPEALERWPADLLRKVLPRHFEIIEEIDRRFRESVRERHPGDEEIVRRTSLFDPSGQVRMAHLGVVGCHSVNGVAALHTEIVKTSVFADLHRLFPGRINNKTNGITPRRWLLLCNPALADLIREAIGESWTSDLSQLRQLAPLAEDAAFRERWAAIKHANKVAVTERALLTPKADLDPGALFDMQVKRIHEYKRQLLNLLHAIALYHRIQDGEQTLPRAVLFAGKAAPGYVMAKLIIKLVHAVADMVNADPRVRRRLRVAFLPNYSVSLAQLLMPATELSEQISTAGTEASGTGNMKAALNGGIIIGTLDGANVEIREEVGAENMFIFGKTAEEIGELGRSGARPQEFVDRDPELKRVIATLSHGALARANPGLFDPLVAELLGADRYFLCADFRSYLDCQQRVADTYLRPDDWVRMSIRNVAGMGKFSSDRTIREYAEQIWQATPVQVPQLE